ncbi:MAG: NfeD family protein [Methanobacteriaceae archaeon]|nr:NfeD family protein [Methanobacteriaceae archaeon]
MIDLQIWIFLAAACFLGEMLTTTFFLMWFGVGASVSAVLNYLGFDPLTQFIVFIVVSIILLGISRPFAQRISKISPKKAASDRLIGKKGVVMEEITPKMPGLVKVDGDRWKAISTQPISSGELVKIEKIDSVKLVVKPWKDD